MRLRSPLAALLSWAILAAGVGLSQAAAAYPDDAKKQKDPTKKEDKKPERNVDPLDPFGNLEDLFKLLPGLDDDTAKLLQMQMEQTRRMLELLRKQGAGGGLGQLPGGGLLPLPLPFPDLQRLNPRMNLNRRPDASSSKLTEPRLGARLEKPSMTLIDQLDLPRDQGLILDDLRADSAAAKAGLKQHDILMELNGKPVPSDSAQFAKLLQDIKADEAIEAVVLHKSKKETIKGLKLPEAGNQPKPGGRPAPFRLDVPFGELGDAIKIDVNIQRKNGR